MEEEDRREEGGKRMEGGGRREEEEGPGWSFRVVGFDCRAIRRHLEVIWRHLESSGGIWSHLEASGVQLIQDGHFVLSVLIVGPSGGIWRHLESSGREEGGWRR